MRAIPERLRNVSCIGAIQIDITFMFTCNTSKQEKDVTRHAEFYRNESEVGMNYVARLLPRTDVCENCVRLAQ